MLDSSSAAATIGWWQNKIKAHEYKREIIFKKNRKFSRLFLNFCGKQNAKHRDDGGSSLELQLALERSQQVDNKVRRRSMLGLFHGC